MAKQRKAAKKTTAKKKSPKPKREAARSKRGPGEREVHYSDLRKVMLASVLKRLT